MLADHPQVPVGVHLTPTTDLPAVPWALLTRGASIQEDGHLVGVERRERLLARAAADEAEAELRAQIEAALAVEHGTALRARGGCGRTTVEEQVLRDVHDPQGGDADAERAREPLTLADGQARGGGVGRPGRRRRRADG